MAGLDQSRMAERAGVTAQTITNFEKGRTQGNANTLKVIETALNKAGIIITDDGVRKPRTNEILLEGSDWFCDLLDDVYYTLMDNSDAELLVDMADDSASSIEVVNRYRKIRNASIKMRQTIEEGNKYLMGPVKEYRWIPKRYYKNWVILVYGNKVAYSLENEMKCKIIIDADLAERERNKFNLVWGLLPELDIRSTANERF